MSSNQTNGKNISSMTNNNKKKRSFFNLQSTKELIKYSDSILESHEGEFVKVQNLLTAKKRYTNDAHMDNDDTIILTTYGKVTIEMIGDRVFQVLVLNLGVVLIVPEAIKNILIIKVLILLQALPYVKVKLK